MGNCQVITGGAGFIGSNFVRHQLRASADHILIVDKLTYAGNKVTTEDVLLDPRVTFVEADIADSRTMAVLVRDHNPWAIVNFAAESHVDRSIDGPRNFIMSNTVGVFELLECARHYLADQPADIRNRFRFLQVSTDEVFGSLGPEGAFTEETPYSPRSPYSATKAGADHLVRAYHETYGLQTLITNSSNNYGPFQFPEKLIPLMTLNALEGKALPVYGQGDNVRDWLHVRDHCEAIARVLEDGKPGATYNVGSRTELTNLDTVFAVCAAMESVFPGDTNPRLQEQGFGTYRELVTFVQDRPGHDFRYAIDPSRIQDELGWEASIPFIDGLEETVRWYVNNLDWCQDVQADVYSGERLGLGERGPT